MEKKDNIPQSRLVVKNDGSPWTTDYNTRVYKRQVSLKTI